MALGYFAGIGHRTSGTNSLYTIKAKHVQYGGIVSGPQATYNGSYTRETLLSTPSGAWASESNETYIVTNAFAMFGLGYLNRDGSGTLLADFPKPAVKDDEVFIEAGIVSNTVSATKVRATINNRSLWPAKAYNNLRFRYYFTLEIGATVTNQTITAHDASTAPTISSPVLVSGNQYYVEVAFTDKLFPGGEDGISGRPNTFPPVGTLPNQAMNYRRTVEFQLDHNSAFLDTDDWSFAGLPVVSGSVQPIKSKQVPVYDGGTKIFGNEPGGFDFELWVDANNDGIINSGDSRVNGNAAPVDFGSTGYNVPVTRNFIARNTTPVAITINPLWQMPQGFSRVTEGTITVPANNGTTSFQIRFDADGYCTQTGEVIFVTSASNPLENPFKFKLSGYVPYAGVSVADGTLPLRNNDMVDLGTTQQGTALTKNLVIANYGCDNLLLSNYTLPNGYAFLVPPPQTIAAGGSSTLQLVLTSCTPGTKTGDLSFTSNDPAQPAMIISLTGSVTAFDIAAHAGNDQFVVSSNPVVLQAAALPSGSPAFTGTWTIGGGKLGTFSDVSDPGAVFNPGSGPGNYALIWTVSNGNCSTLDSVSITVSGVLPVTFGTVTAVARNCNVYLSFDYLNQQNNDRFVVEYSANGGNWQEIATLSNVGNISSRSFSYLHATPAAGANYYRIKQIDVNGSYSYSKTVQATSNCAGQSRIVTYPNPVQSTLTVILPANNGKSLLQITDATGKIVGSTSTQKSFTTINTQMLASGLYQLHVIIGEKVVYTTKFVKQ